MTSPGLHTCNTTKVSNKENAHIKTFLNLKKEKKHLMLITNLKFIAVTKITTTRALNMLKQTSITRVNLGYLLF